MFKSKPPIRVFLVVRGGCGSFDSIGRGVRVYQVPRVGDTLALSNPGDYDDPADGRHEYKVAEVRWGVSLSEWDSLEGQEEGACVYLEPLKSPPSEDMKLLDRLLAHVSFFTTVNRREMDLQTLSAESKEHALVAKLQKLGKIESREHHKDAAQEPWFKAVNKVLERRECADLLALAQVATGVTWVVDSVKDGKQVTLVSELRDPGGSLVGVARVCSDGRWQVMSMTVGREMIWGVCDSFKEALKKAVGEETPAL